MSNIIIFIGSMRKNGNTARLTQSFAEGAARNNNVEIVSVADCKVNPCIGCNSCFTREGNKCFQNDDMLQIYGDLYMTAYNVSGELKELLAQLVNAEGLFFYEAPLDNFGEE